MCTTLTIEKDRAIKAHEEGETPIKKLLEGLFGTDTFKPKSITDRVKTFEDALAIVGANVNQTFLLEYHGLDKDILAAQAILKLTIVAKALNEGWTPDWSNTREYKYYPWFRNTGSGFSFGGCVLDDSFSIVGSRLVFKNNALAEYAGKQFEGLYQQWMNL